MVNMDGTASKFWCRTKLFLVDVVALVRKCW